MLVSVINVYFFPHFAIRFTYILSRTQTSLIMKYKRDCSKIINYWVELVNFMNTIPFCLQLPE
jgi:hypothetical protein